MLHSFAGLRYSQIKQDQGLQYAGVATGSFITTSTSLITMIYDPFTSKIQRDDRFNGIGPLLGLDVDLKLDDGVSLVGHVDTALLVGNANSKLNVQYQESSNFYEPIIAAQMSSKYSENKVVPSIDAKVGGKYKYVFSNAMAVSLEGGYSYSQYFNVLDQLDASAIETYGTDKTELTFAFNSISHKTANFALYGPYISLTVGF